jgi:hypothetical protein
MRQHTAQSSLVQFADVSAVVPEERDEAIAVLTLVRILEQARAS